MPSINEAVAAKLAGISPVVNERVTDLLVEKEVGRRVELITQGLSKLNEAERETRKLSKPNTETFNADGSTATTGFTKDALEALNKHNEKTEKLRKALDKAVDAGDIGDLANLVK